VVILEREIMQTLLRILVNAPTFVILYLLFMVPTYLLPYLGSNSGVFNTVAVANNFWQPTFLLHLACLVILCLLAWARGSLISKSWVIVFPIIALAFDLLPVLNFVPFVPTVMHLLAVILGVSSSAKQAT
jgi:hypothetical protein